MPVEVAYDLLDHIFQVIVIEVAQLIQVKRNLKGQWLSLRLRRTESSLGLAPAPLVARVQFE